MLRSRVVANTMRLTELAFRVSVKVCQLWGRREDAAERKVVECERMQRRDQLSSFTILPYLWHKSASDGVYSFMVVAAKAGKSLRMFLMTLVEYKLPKEVTEEIA